MAEDHLLAGPVIGPVIGSVNSKTDNQSLVSPVVVVKSARSRQQSPSQPVYVGRFVLTFHLNCILMKALLITITVIGVTLGVWLALNINPSGAAKSDEGVPSPS